MADKMSTFMSHGDDTICYCDNCGRVTFAKNIVPLSEVPDLRERLSEGSEVPAGECDRCGAFTYVLDFKEAKDRHVRVSPNNCPVCNAHDLDADAPMTVDDGFECSVSCHRCKSTWTEVYALNEVRNFKPHADPDKYKKPTEEG